MTTEPFRYRCQHGVDLYHECMCCSIHTIGSQSQWLRAARNLANSPTYQKAARGAQLPASMPLTTKTGRSIG